jgi:hypothetical protein
MPKVRLALQPGSAPTVKDWTMNAGGIKARERIHRRVVYLRFTSQNTTGLVFPNLSMLAKLELYIWFMVEGPEALLFHPWRSRCSLCCARYILS